MACLFGIWLKYRDNQRILLLFREIALVAHNMKLQMDLMLQEKLAI